MMSDLKQEILAEAQRLGFLLAGVSHPGPLISYPTYEQWLEAKRHGTMAYLATEQARLRRSNPGEILPEVKSILVLGLPYKAIPASQAGSDPKRTGKIAAYAAGEDYHLTIPSLLEGIVQFVQGKTGQTIRWRGYTDTGPVLERELAQRAGLGWIGKNSCMISPKYGSYFLLAEILWDLALDADTPITHDFCGSCTRCIEACPTDCILPNRTLDARRCISYLTIENKGEIARELRPLTGDWIFGCDICQQVCPWNLRFASARPQVTFPVTVLDRQPTYLLDELSHTPQTFNRRFRFSPILRAKRRGYLRNINVALGNRTDPAFVPFLKQLLLAEPEGLVRAHAAWALGEIGGPEAYEALTIALKGESETGVSLEIATALRKF